MSQTLVIFAALAMTLACFSCMRSFMAASREEDYGRAFWYKGAASLCFVGLSLAATLRCGDGAYAWKLVLGLVLGLVGDELLALRFLRPQRHDAWFSAGAAAFALGHGLYVWAAFQRGGPILDTALILFVLLLGLSGVYAGVKGSHRGPQRFSAAVYIALVCFMAASACAAAVKVPGASSVLMALGALGFVLSDNVLCAYCFGEDRRFGLNWLIHISYYAAQLCIAWSIFFA